jgi:hypothetical protein
VATLGARNANEAVVNPTVGSGAVCIWREPGVWKSGGRFCVGAFGRNLASVAVKMFPHLIRFIRKFYTYNMICKDNAAINCIIVQHKRCSLPSTLTGHTTLVITAIKLAGVSVMAVRQELVLLPAL